jgi:hypothetical protein
MTWQDVLAIVALLLSHLGMAGFALWSLHCDLDRRTVSPEKPAGVPPRAPVFFLPDGEFWDVETRGVSR